jgi:hypothetical protein
MSRGDQETIRFAANSLFPTVFCATVSLVLAQLWAVQIHGSWRLHVFLGTPGLALLGLALFRARLHWSADSTLRRTRRASDFAWYLLLLAIGVFTGTLITAGSMLLLAMVAALTYLIPWVRIPVCRAGFIVSALVTLAGTFGWVAVYDGPVHPLHYVAAAWLLFIPAMCAQSLVLLALDRSYRIGEKGRAGKPLVGAASTELVFARWRKS